LTKHFFTVGPAALYPKIDEFFSEFVESGYGSISHRSAQFREMYAATDRALRRLLNIPSDFAVFFCGSASEIWERILFNTVIERSCHFSNGDFSRRFYEYATALGIQSTIIENKPGKAFDSNHLDLLSVPYELITCCFNETSTGVSISNEWVSAMRKKQPSALIAVDLVSAVPLMDFDFANADMAYFSGQKGFGLPTGIGVWIVHPRCLDKAKDKLAKGHSIGAHHTLPKLFKHYSHFETPSTPNVLGVYLLGKIAEDLDKANLIALKNKQQIRSDFLYSFFDQSSLIPFVKEKEIRSPSTIVIETNDKTESIFQELLAQGLIVSKGYGKFKDKHLRIANFPANLMMEVEFIRLVEAFKDHF
jgi:phosphoserine aminotransferase